MRAMGSGPFSGTPLDSRDAERFDRYLGSESMRFVHKVGFQNLLSEHLPIC